MNNDLQRICFASCKMYVCTILKLLFLVSVTKITYVIKIIILELELEVKHKSNNLHGFYRTDMNT